MPLESSPLVVKVVGERSGDNDVAYHAQPVREACKNSGLERTQVIYIAVCVTNQGHPVSSVTHKVAMQCTYRFTDIANGMRKY